MVFFMGTRFWAAILSMNWYGTAQFPCWTTLNWYGTAQFPFWTTFCSSNRTVRYWYLSKAAFHFFFFEKLRYGTVPIIDQV